jgi:hypothetical protein
MLDSTVTATTIADEIERLRAAELEAQHQYYEVVEKSELTAKRYAASVWIRAGDALNDCLAKQFDPSSDSG